MGGGSWSGSAYNAAAARRAAKGIDDFDHDHRVKTGRAKGVHPTLDPTKLIHGIRESRDSDEHPESLPIAVIFDVTGSMGGIPRTLQKKLANLMDVVIAKAGIRHPQILVGAVGDAYADQYPFQIGQFESDNRFDEQLREIILEGGGGGQEMESYGLAYRFAAYHTALDAFEKRGKKGYLFTIGDEMPWPSVTAEEVHNIFDVKAEKDETVEELIAKVQEKWEVFHIFPMDGSYPNHTGIHARWRMLIGERFVKLDDQELVCEVIAGLVHMLETAHDLDTVVRDIGVTGAAGKVVKDALVPVAKAVVPGGHTKGGLPKKHVAQNRSGISRI
ncbi:MAG: hypothetical protein AAB581_01110 [Patescibacteria group bacterium]